MAAGEEARSVVAVGAGKNEVERRGWWSNVASTERCAAGDGGDATSEIMPRV